MMRGKKIKTLHKLYWVCIYVIDTVAKKGKKRRKKENK